ncbi:helix-turn-helix transcriptional regulator [Rothia nasimurium]|uniref:helix-turn-helix domain-containing protein n=2 Tax=Rothia nasimurium TaxID=85336 RepID=UPI0030145514
METGNRKAAGLANAFSSRLNEEIRVWMTRRGENLRTLEAATGISRSRLSRTVNRDEAPINTNELDLICKALGISPSEIIGIAERAVLAQQEQAEPQRPSGRYNSAGEWVPATRDGYTLAAYETDEEKGVDYIDD